MVEVIRFRGVGYLWYLFHGVLLQRLGMRIVDALRGYRRFLALAAFGASALLVSGYLLLGIRGVGLYALVLLGVIAGIRLESSKKLRRLQEEARRLTGEAAANRDTSLTRWSQLPVAEDTRRAVEEASSVFPGEELAIGRIDQDGRFLGTFGPLPGLDPVDANEFTERVRFDLDVVLINDFVLVRKDYRGDRRRFVHEWYALAKLRGKVRVPAIHSADENKCRLYLNFIPGRTVRDVLVAAGYAIRDCDVREDSALSLLSRRSRARVITKRGAAGISSCVSGDFLTQCREQLEAVHCSGFARLGAKTGNIIIDQEDGRPWLIDFEPAREFASLENLLARVWRDHDRRAFNRVFGTQLLTERSARAALSQVKRGCDRFYAPADFGGGVTIGSFWSVKSGTGRWEFLNGPILTPIVMGRKVLDLGSNNGLMALLMLRAGASEVAGVELSEKNIEMARVIQRIFEWRDMCSYSLRMEQADMESFISASRERFDVVTALCSLYYLEPEHMRRVVRHAAAMAETMVVQCNLAKEWKKASPAFLEELLWENGFPVIEVHAPKGYSRPLLVGQRSASGKSGSARPGARTSGEVDLERDPILTVTRA